LAIAAVLAGLLVPFAARAQDSNPAELPVVVFFYQDGCPDCAAMEELLEGLATDLPPSAVERLEISTTANLRLLRRLEEAYGIDVSTVPILFVGDRVIAGAGKAQEFQLRAAIGDCATVGCSSPLARLEPSTPLWRSVVELALLGVLVLALALLQLP
jgi:thiol-disulfide isomerase/thioredoxin